MYSQCLLEQIEQMDQAVKAMKKKGEKHLTFALAYEEYGISTMKIRGISRMLPITSVPQTPDFVKA
ncbi:MAG: chemotaxis protein CheW [Candidatus Adiutricales bacterium]